jgi:hypothetical protein
VRHPEVFLTKAKIIKGTTLQKRDKFILIVSKKLNEMVANDERPGKLRGEES